jgi:superfamily II DNA or RNA helicase
MKKLRDYQVLASDSIIDEFKDGDSTLLVLPTGLGKTVIFSDVIRRVDHGKAMVVAHREELIFQAQKTVESTIDAQFGIEMGDFRSSDDLFRPNRGTIATIQTLNSRNGDRKRMGKFNPHEFSILVIDEAHHATSDTYGHVINYFRQNPNLKVLGVTATPDRADEEALGKVFNTVAMDYEILDAIHDGWLVDIEQMMVPVAGLDFSHIKVQLGDLAQGALDAVMEEESSIAGVAHPTIEAVFRMPVQALHEIPVAQWGATCMAAGEPRRTLVFTASVRQAEMLANIFNRIIPRVAHWVCGETNRDERRKIVADYNGGLFPILVNCNCFSEGFDSPGVELVVQAKPTLSRALYAQQIGRGTRPLPGVVDGLEAPEQRVAAIKASAKPVLTVMDFVGNSGRHKLINSADILGGKVRDDVLDRAIRKLQKDGKPVKVADAIDEAQREEAEAVKKRLADEEARKRQLVAKVDYKVKIVDPFSAFGLTPVRIRGWDKGKAITEKQRNVMIKQGLDPDMEPSMARQILNELFRRWKSDLCTVAQANLIKKYRPSTLTNKLTRKDATMLIDQIKEGGWRRNT